MIIDLETLSLVLILSSAIQSIFIFNQSFHNKKIDGIKEYALGSMFLSLGFLFVFLIKQDYIAVFSLVSGHIIIMLAIVYQHIGMTRFMGIKVRTRLLTLFFTVSSVLIVYYSVLENEIMRRVVASLFAFIVLVTISKYLIRKHAPYLKLSARFLGIIYFIIGLFSLLNGVNLLANKYLEGLISPIVAQKIAYLLFFTVPLVTTLWFISTINLRLKAGILESKERFEHIFNLSPDAAIICGFHDGNIINYNNGFLTLFGFTAQNISGNNLHDLGIYADPDEINNIKIKLSGIGSLKNIETVFNGEDGCKIVCIVSYEKLLINNAHHLIIIAHDITERKETVETLKTDVEKYRFLTEFGSDVTWVYNLTNNEYTYVSPSVYEIRGFTAEEVIFECLEDSFTPDTYPILMSSILKNMDEDIKSPSTNDDCILELQQPCKNGEIIWTEVSIKCNRNDYNDIEIIGVSRNIERRKKFEKHAMYLSYHDQLTGLYNRHYYEEELKNLDTQKNLPLSLIIADVNGLKLINDAFGHVAGDILLEKVASVFRAACSTQEVVSRVGGDEFVFLLPRKSKSEADKFVLKVKEEISKERIYDVELTVSFGLSTKTIISDDITLVYSKAEDNMYRSKLSEKTEIRNRTIAIILNSLYKKNNYERLHSKNVGNLCEKIATALFLGADEVHEIRTAGLMHDIGKIGISDFIINKNNNLNEAEYNEIKRHTETGYRILNSSNEFVDIAEYVLEHHERWDGKGYPRGLKSEEISLPARIISVADAFDVMTSERAYCNNRSESEAIAEIKCCAGTQFDPNIAKVFVESVLGKRW
jgi:diguanylate cyclase (GGDEF)-like protein/PAS domain S-box-containing protein/putative nucleotidyltransferase with HDIG domain